MNKEQIQTVFDYCGLSKMGEVLSYKLWIKGLGESCDPDILENFLITYDLSDENIMLVDDFLFHFQIYRSAHTRWLSCL